MPDGDVDSVKFNRIFVEYNFFVACVIYSVAPRVGMSFPIFIYFYFYFVNSCILSNKYDIKHVSSTSSMYLSTYVIKHVIEHVIMQAFHQTSISSSKYVF